MKRQTGSGINEQLETTGGASGGDASAANQVIGNASLASIDTKLTNPLPVSVASVPLPTGASTATRQDTGNTSLASIDTKTPALGQALAAASSPVVLTAAQVTTLTPPAAITGFLSEADFDAKTGSLTETAPTTDTASSGLNGRLQRIAQRTTSLITALGSPFQAGASIGNTSFAATQATAANLNAQTVGNIAHDGVDSGNPVKIGSRAVAFGSNPTGVSAADRVDQIACVAGVPFVLEGHPNVLTLRANYTSAQTDTKIITVSAGTKIVMVSCTIDYDAAATNKPAIRAGFAASTTPTTTGVYISHPGLNPGSGVAERTPVAGADGDDFIITCAAPNGNGIDVVAKYFTIET